MTAKVQGAQGKKLAPKTITEYANHFLHWREKHGGAVYWRANHLDNPGWLERRPSDAGEQPLDGIVRDMGRGIFQ